MMKTPRLYHWPERLPPHTIVFYKKPKRTKKHTKLHDKWVQTRPSQECKSSKGKGNMCQYPSHYLAQKTGSETSKDRGRGAHRPPAQQPEHTPSPHTHVRRKTVCTLSNLTWLSPNLHLVLFCFTCSVGFFKFEFGYLQMSSHLAEKSQNELKAKEFHSNFNKFVSNNFASKSLLQVGFKGTRVGTKQTSKSWL